MIAVSGGLNNCDVTELENAEGTITFSMLLEDSLLKSSIEDSIAIKTHAVIFSLARENGDLVFNNERMELYDFNGHWVTKEISLRVGLYKLLAFMVVDTSGSVIFVCPLEGSPKGYLVNDPLPIPVVIRKDDLTRITPEVLAVDDSPPEAYGYVSFGYEVVRVLDFFLAAYIDNPMIMAPSRFTEAELAVSIDSSWSHSFKLRAQINNITVPARREIYCLLVRKEGYIPVQLYLSPKELRESSPDHPILAPLKFEMDPFIRLKPGPEKGKDATVFKSKPDENFGDYPYFEAASAPPRVWYDRIETSRSMITFDLSELPAEGKIAKATLTLYNEFPIYTDSIPNELMPKFKGVFQRIIEPWKEEEVTWNNQPEITEEGQVYLEPSPWMSANSYTVEVTGLINELRYKSVESSFGILFRLVLEEGISGFSFASSDHPDQHFHPELRIYLAK